MLVDTKDMFKKALKGKYAIGAFNVNDMELVQAIVAAAAEKKAPVILQISKGAREYANPIYLTKLIEAAVLEHPELPIVMHLDHGPDFETCKAAVDEGYTSVMIDRSHDSYEDNVRITKQVVDYAHKHGVVVEAELGQLVGSQFDEGESGGKIGNGLYTDPDQAVDFVKRTGCDSLAVAIGTSHGAYKFKGEPYLDLDRLKEIASKLKGFPLVLHGASSVIPEYVEEINRLGGKMPGAHGVSEELLSKASKLGICKVNTDTDLRLAMTAAIREDFTKHPEDFDPRKYLGPAREEVKKMVMHKLEVLGNVNRI
jgi:fructose-bisphosphate aldolase class II